MDEASCRWAIAGTGDIARRFAADLRHSRRGRVTAVASRDPDRAMRLAAGIGMGVAHGDLDGVLRRADVDAVYVATRNEDHAGHALRALAAGKPVLVEKPFATSAEEAAEIAEAARRSGLLAMEAMWMRFTPGIRRMKQLLDAGAIGPVRAIEAGLSFRVRQPSASVLLDLGVYPVSLAVDLLGLPDRLSASGSAGGDRAGFVLGYRGAVATLSCGYAGQGPNRLAVTGETGVLSTDGPFICPSMLTLGRAGEGGSAASPSGEAPLPSLSRPGWLRSARAMLRPLAARRIPVFFEGTGLHYQADHFAECLAAGLSESPVMPLSHSIGTLRLLGAIQACLDDQAGGRGAKLETGR